MIVMKKIQEKVKKFSQECGWESPPEQRVLDALSELGELSKEVLETSRYGKKPSKASQKVVGEVGDVFYSLITIANYFDVDLEKALDQALSKYKKRLIK